MDARVLQASENPNMELSLGKIRRKTHGKTEEKWWENIDKFKEKHVKIHKIWRIAGKTIELKLVDLP